MAHCAACGQFIVFGGVRDSGNVFCNNNCFHRGIVAAVAQSVPADIVDRETRTLHSGYCPHCNGPGPVDVHRSHSIVSFLIMTRWGTTPHVCCRRCAKKKQLGAMGLCAVTGWWGFPWGIIGTPIQMVRNLCETFGGPNPAQPSADLQQIVASMLAAQAVAAHAPPPIPPGPRGFEVVQPSGTPAATPPPLPPVS